MRRAKRGPALFELLNERGLKAPEDQGAQGVSVETMESAPAETEPRGITRELPALGERSAILVVDGERLHVSLTSMSAAGAAFVLLAVLAVSAILGFKQGRTRGLADGFAAGRASYLAETATEIEAARQQVPATYLVGGLLDAGAAPSLSGNEPRLSGDVQAGGEAGEAGWIAGFTYVVVQEFSAKNVSDVEPAQQFLAEHGVETRTLPLSSGGVRLITTQGFDRKDPAQRKLADQLLEKIRAIGTQYFASGGRYKLEGYFKTLTGD